MSERVAQREVARRGVFASAGTEVPTFFDILVSEEICGRPGSISMDQASHVSAR